MKKLIPMILFATVPFSFGCQLHKTANAAFSNPTEKAGIDTSYKTIVIGNDHSNTRELVSALSYFLAGKGLGSFISLEDMDQHMQSFTANNETLEMCEVELRTSAHSHRIFVNENHEMTGKFLKAQPVRFDAAILVVSHTDGPMPFTRNHLELFKKSGINHLFCFVTKAELVDDPELSQIIKDQILELMRSVQIDVKNVSVVFGTTQTDLIKAQPQWVNSFQAAADFLDALKR